MKKERGEERGKDRGKERRPERGRNTFLSLHNSYVRSSC